MGEFFPPMNREEKAGKLFISSLCLLFSFSAGPPPCVSYFLFQLVHLLVSLIFFFSWSTSLCLLFSFSAGPPPCVSYFLFQLVHLLVSLIFFFSWSTSLCLLFSFSAGPPPCVSFLFQLVHSLCLLFSFSWSRNDDDHLMGPWVSSNGHPLTHHSCDL